SQSTNDHRQRQLHRRPDSPPLSGITGSPYGYVDNDPLNGSDPLGLFGLSSITHAVSKAAHFASHHAGQIAAGAAIIGGVACVATVACGVALAGALGPEALAAAAGVGALGGVAASVGLVGEDGGDSLLYRF